MREAVADLRKARFVLLAGLAAGLASVVLVALPSKWMVAAIAGMIVSIVALVQTDLRRYFQVLLVMSLPLATFSKHFFAREDYFGVAGIGFGVIEASLLALYILWLASGVSWPDVRRAFRSPVNLAALTLLAVVALSVPFAADRQLALFGLADALKAYSLFFYVACNLRPRYVVWVVDALAVTVLVQELLAAAQYVTRSSLGLASFGESELMRMTFGGETFVRVAATLVHPNQFANFLGLILPVLLSMVLTGRTTPGRRLFYAVVVALGILVFVMSFSRTGWVHLAVSTFVVVALSLRRGIVRREVSNIVVLGGIVLCIALLVFSGAIVARLFHSDPVLVTMRFDMVRVAMRMIADRPLTGVGTNNYVNVLPDYDFIGVMSAPVHNLYLLLAAETGPLGAVAFVAFLAALARQLWRAGRAAPAASGAVAVGVLGGLAGFAADGLSDFSYALASTHALFWFLAGIALALGVRPGGEA